MLKTGIFILFFMAAMVSAVSADYGHMPQGSQSQSVEGRVASIDWVSSSLVLKFLVGATYEEIKLYFPKIAKIVKSNKEIELSDVELSDLMRVVYYADEKERKDIVIRAEVVE